MSIGVAKQTLNLDSHQTCSLPAEDLKTWVASPSSPSISTTLYDVDSVMEWSSGIKTPAPSLSSFVFRLDSLTAFCRSR